MDGSPTQNSNSGSTAYIPASLPLILDGNFFRVIAEDGLKVTGQCTLCPSRIMGLKTTTSNFNTHLKKMHPERHKVYEEYKIERGQSIKKRRSSLELGQPQRRRISNPNTNGSFQNMMNGIRSSPNQNRPKAHFMDNTTGSGDLAPKRRQSSFIPQHNANVGMRSVMGNRRSNGLPHANQGSIPASSLPPAIRARRKETDDIVFNYMIKSLSPPTLVETPHFMSLVSGLCATPRRVMSSKTLVSRINMQSMVKRGEIARKLAKTEVICVTADAWTLTTDTTNKFIVLTAHWIGMDLKLISALLGCRRFSTEMNYAKLVEVLTEILGIYNVPNERICCIVTSNATNFLPTRIYQIQHELDEDEDSEAQELCPSIDDDSVTNEDLAFYNINSILSNSEFEDDPVPLPSHYDCPTQTLIGVLTTSTFETLSNPENPTSYIFQSSIAKCQALWKACSNKEAGERIHVTYGVEILIPNKVNWGSFLEGINCLLAARDVIDEIYMYFSLPHLEDTELDFLEEYASVMEPVKEALTILQDESELCMGSFVPTLLNLRAKLEDLNLEVLKFTNHLVECLLNGLNDPFTDILTLDSKARPLIMASILHPNYKLTWIPIEKIGELKDWYLEEATSYKESLTGGSPPNKKDKKSEDFEHNHHQGDTTNVLMEFANYLETPIEPLESGQLEGFPNVKKLFITFNTAVASSVPVERLINFAEVSFAPPRPILKDEMLENMLILKCN